MNEIRFDTLGPGDYDRGKAVFNRAKHPGFIGRELFFRAATTGVACIAVLDDIDCGIALIAKNKLLALSVISAAQGRGIGPALMTRLQPKWVQSIGERVGFFEKLGYRCVGAPKIGANGKHSTQLLELPDGTQLSSGAIGDAKAAPAFEEPVQVQVPSLAALGEETPLDRIDAELEVLDVMLKNAVRDGRESAAMKIMDKAKRLLRERDLVRAQTL